jgi:hypothetical protein
MIGGVDVIWGIFVMACIMGWFVGAGCVAWFILHFKPTRKLINKFIDFDLY